MSLKINRNKIIDLQISLMPSVQPSTLALIIDMLIYLSWELLALGTVALLKYLTLLVYGISIFFFCVKIINKKGVDGTKASKGWLQKFIKYFFLAFTEVKWTLC